MPQEKTKLGIFAAIAFIWLAILSAAAAYLILHKNDKPTAESLGFYPVTVYNTSGTSDEAALHHIIEEERASVRNDGEQMLIFAKALTTDIYLPDSMAFAGEKVPLNRLDIRESLVRELSTNTYLHASTLQILRIFPRMSAIILPIIREEGLPDDFIYLAVCESALNVLAVSPSKAAGIWQFLASTGKEYGLEINNNTDERYNIEKSTRAACAYLKKAKEKFGSWTLAAASYNCGMGMISRQTAGQYTENYYDLLLSDETNRYIFRILALKQIISHPEKYNFQIDSPYPAEPCTKITVKSDIKDLARWAQEHGITYKTLKRFNPWMRQTSLDVRRGQSYEILIPENKELYR